MIKGISIKTLKKLSTYQRIDLVVDRQYFAIVEIENLHSFLLFIEQNKMYCMSPFFNMLYENASIKN